MAQVRKEEVREGILDAAREEFLQCGFSGASLRNIAQRAHITKGAIYIYFPNKEALLEALVAPAVNYIEKLLSPCQADCCPACSNAPFSSYDATVQSFQDCANYVLGHHDAFRLLLFGASGSYYRDFKERIILMYARCIHQLFASIDKNSDDKGCRFSDMLIHSLANMFVCYLEEIVLHEPARDEVLRYVHEMAHFIHGGCHALYQTATE